MRPTKPIYLDYAAATPTALPVLSAMRPYWRSHFGNPSSLHASGQHTKYAIDESRAHIAKYIQCLPEEIIFTSGGTESINLALRGYISSVNKPTQHIISTTIEHPVVKETLLHLSKQGHQITYVNSEKNGIVDPKKIINSITEKTTLISVIYIQNEIGTVQPVEEIGKQLTNINRERIKKGKQPIILHTDACQAPAFISMNMKRVHAHLVSFDGAKMYGPKGIGLLYKQKGVRLAPILFGGGQEKGLRSGSEPVQLVVGLSAAFAYTHKQREKQVFRVMALRDYFMNVLTDTIKNCEITGDRKNRIANNVHITIPNVEGEQLVLYLSKRNIYVSTGSACSSAENNESHVVKALALPKERRAGSLRFSLGYATRKHELDYTATLLRTIVQRLNIY